MLADLAAVSEIGRPAPIAASAGRRKAGSKLQQAPARRRELHACNSRNRAIAGKQRPSRRPRRPPIWRIPEPPILFLLVGKRGNAGNGKESALQNADVAQLVEHHLAKVDVASSNLVVRSQDTVTAKVLLNRRLHGGLAERRGSGLQSRIHGFESRTHLGENHGFRMISGWQWAIGAAVARFPDTEEVTGSIPVSPTKQGNLLHAVRPVLPVRTAYADVAQLVEHHLAKVDVASSNLVVRSLTSP